MQRIVKIEGIALFLLVSSTSQAGLPTYMSSGDAVPGREALTMVSRMRESETMIRRPATPANVELALYELVESSEEIVEKIATCEWDVVLTTLAGLVVDDASETTRLAANDNADGSVVADSKLQVAFAGTQHGPFDDLVLAAARRWQLDPFLLKGLLANESNLEPVQFGKRRYAKHNDKWVVVAGGAIGIAQFSGGGIRAVRALRAKRRRRGESALDFDLDRALVPQEAIFAAAELLSHLLTRYGRDGGITAYNSGVIGGLAVRRLGFWNARRAGKLRRSGIYHVQGERFLLNVLRRTNHYRRAAGLAPIDQPERPLDPETRVAVL